MNKLSPKAPYQTRCLWQGEQIAWTEDQVLVAQQEASELQPPTVLLECHSGTLQRWCGLVGALEVMGAVAVVVAVLPCMQAENHKRRAYQRCLDADGPQQQPQQQQQQQLYFSETPSFPLPRDNTLEFLLAARAFWSGGEPR